MQRERLNACRVLSCKCCNRCIISVILSYAQNQVYKLGNTVKASFKVLRIFLDQSVKMNFPLCWRERSVDEHTHTHNGHKVRLQINFKIYQ